MNMYLDIGLIILLIAVLSWREVQILIDRDSWKDWDYRKLFWYTDQNSKEKILWVIPKKNLDSFHVSNGIATLIIIELLVQYLPKPVSIEQYVGIFIENQLYVIAYWLLWMQIRNWFMKFCRK